MTISEKTWLLSCECCSVPFVGSGRLCETCQEDAALVYLELKKMFKFHKPMLNGNHEKSILNLGTVSEAAELVAMFTPAVANMHTFLSNLLLALKAVEYSGFQGDLWKKELVLNLDIDVKKTIKECYDSIYYPIRLANHLGYSFKELLKHGNDVNNEKYGKAGGYYAKNIEKQE